MPPCAISKAPETRSASPPLSPSVPNSSISSRSAGSAEQFTTTNGPSARFEPWWISRATVSLPAPEAPVISTRLPVGATRSIWVRTLAAAPDEPTKRHLAAGAAAQAGVLAPQPVGLDGAVDHQQQPVGLEGLLDEVVGAGLDRRRRRCRSCRGR